MRIIIFGGAGFLGKKLARELLKRGELSVDGQAPRKIRRLALFDNVEAVGLPADPRLEVVVGDIRDQTRVRSVLEDPVDVIFHLAAVVSGEAEKNFDLGMAVNLHATLQLLELCRNLPTRPVLVFASSCAVFGGELSETISDYTAPMPRSSYGTQKAVADLLISDFSRRGFVDGRCLRLPTIVVRPGKPNAATSSFASSIIREPLQKQRAVCPVAPDTKVWILSPKQVIENFIHAAQLPAAALGANRIINLPGITLSVAEMVSALEAVAGPETRALIDWVPDPFIQSIVMTWPPYFNPTRALELGFLRDESMREIIEAFMEEELGEEPS
ncbi:MAG TPA: SDR family oxidoreductase [Flavilitoribacter sp.]|nr:SDR family oxidoreductase [Flavilitoribacter sp.]